MKSVRNYERPLPEKGLSQWQRITIPPVRVKKTTSPSRLSKNASPHRDPVLNSTTPIIPTVSR